MNWLETVIKKVIHRTDMRVQNSLLSKNETDDKLPQNPKKWTYDNKKYQEQHNKSQEQTKNYGGKHRNNKKFTNLEEYKEGYDRNQKKRESQFASNKSQEQWKKR